MPPAGSSPSLARFIRTILLFVGNSMHEVLRFYTLQSQLRLTTFPEMRGFLWINELS
jgi:hypothetical protein